MTLTQKYIASLLLLLFILVQSPSLSASPHSPKLTIAAADTAQHYNGIRELRKNSSPVIDIMIRQGGGRPGWSWCMYFVRYCYNQACTALGLKNKLLKTGSCSAQLRYTYNNPNFQVVILENNPKFLAKKNDILIFKHGSASGLLDLRRDWLGHTAIVTRDQKPGEKIYATIEGNTNQKGGREGDGVYPKTRISTSDFPILAIIRQVA